MASIVIFLEVPEWTWHYPDLDSLVLVACSSFRLYICFSRLFSILVVNWHFDPRRPFANFPLHLAHPPYLPEPPPSASSIEADPSEESSPHTVLHAIKSCSSSTSIKVLPETQPEEDPREPMMETGFTPCRLVIMTWARHFVYVYAYGPWANELVSACLC